MNQNARAMLLCAALSFAALPLFGAAPVAADEATGQAETGAWADIRANLYDDAPLLADGIVAIEAPARAEDAALVPMTVRTALDPADPRHVTEITLIIDENPSPVAATFTLGEEAGVSAISTRVRVNAYTPVHAVAKLSDGSLHVAETFVKASGGCAAPMAKDPDEALANLGRMKLRWFPTAETPKMSQSLAQLMIRHPNNSGLQFDQISRLYIPAHFVTDLSIRQGDELILRMEGGISISEDPSFRCDFVSNGEPIHVEATDTEGASFVNEWQPNAS